MYILVAMQWLAKVKDAWLRQDLKSAMTTHGGSEGLWGPTIAGSATDPRSSCSGRTINVLIDPTKNTPLPILRLYTFDDKTLSRFCVVFSSSDVACNETIYVNSSAAVSLYMTSSSGGDVISRYPSSTCSLYVAARRGQRLSFTVFTLGGLDDAGAATAWEDRTVGGESVRRGGAACDARRTLYIVDGERTASSSLCHLPRFQSRQRLVYTSSDWRVAIYWTWTGHWLQTDSSLDYDVRPFTSYILKVEGRLHHCGLSGFYGHHIVVLRR